MVAALRARVRIAGVGRVLTPANALGYVIRLDHPAATSPETMITLHTELDFGERRI